MMLFISTISYSNPLKIGVAVSGLPISQKVSTANGDYYFGFCIDLMNEICKRIEKQCIYREITLNNQFDTLEQGKIDLLILPRPYTVFDFTRYAMSTPYAVSKIQFVALKENPIKKVGDIKNKKIGVIKTTFYGLLTQSTFNNSNQILPYNSNSDLISDLVQHKIDVIALNNAIALTLLSNNYYDIKFVGSSVSMGDGYGIIALPDKEALIKKINEAILSIEKDGSYISIYQKYYEY